LNLGKLLAVALLLGSLSFGQNITPKVGIPTVTALTSSPNPAGPGQDIVISVTVSPNNATGTVTFYAGPVVTTATLSFKGTAQVTIPGLPAGTYAFSATYGGDTIYAQSSSTPVQQSVVEGSLNTSTTLASSANPSSPGQAITISV
jgi:hypothetical protein